jgi:hypothetical protein
MSDTEKTEEELIPVETQPAADAAGDPPADDDAGDEDEGDTRLATSDDDHEEDLASTTNNARRKKRRELQKRARELAQAELQQLRQLNAQLAQRVASIEGHTIATTEQTIDQRLQKAVSDAQQAEAIMAQAINAGNGEDTILAQRIRDEALREAQQLQAAKAQVQQVRQQSQPQAAPQVDPRVVTYAKEWMDANPWYNPNSGSEEASVVKSIDISLEREGYDPRSIGYWQELTRRVGEVIGDDLPAKTRKGPPVGSQREHAPPSTRKEIYVTPERKQAMIEAGVWDDPQKRQRYLKAYQSYDSSSAR